MKHLSKKTWILIAIGVAGTIAVYIWYRKKQAAAGEGVTAGQLSAGGGGETANAQNEAREARQNAEKMEGEMIASEKTEREAERKEGRESRERQEREEAAQRTLTREEAQEQRNLQMRERQQEFEQSQQEKREAQNTAAASAATANAAAAQKKAASPYNLSSARGHYKNITYKGKPAHEYSTNVAGGIGPKHNIVVLANTANKQPVKNKPAAPAKHSTNHHRNTSVAKHGTDKTPSTRPAANHPAARTPAVNHQTVQKHAASKPSPVATHKAKPVAKHATPAHTSKPKAKAKARVRR